MADGQASRAAPGTAHGAVDAGLGAADWGRAAKQVTLKMGATQRHQGVALRGGLDRKSGRVGTECRSRWSPYH